MPLSASTRIREALLSEGQVSRRWKCPIHGFAAGGCSCQFPDDLTAKESPRCLRRCEAVEYITVPIAALDTLEDGQ